MHKAKTDFESLGSTSKAIGSESSFSLRVDLQLVSSSFLPAKYQSIAYLLLAEADLKKKKKVIKIFLSVNLIVVQRFLWVFLQIYNSWVGMKQGPQINVWKLVNKNAIKLKFVYPLEILPKSLDPQEILVTIWQQFVLPSP